MTYEPFGPELTVEGLCPEGSQCNAQNSWPTKYSLPVAPLRGERKIVTVLFADVANYTSISEAIDPEEVHQIMDGCFKILRIEEAWELVIHFLP